MRLSATTYRLTQIAVAMKPAEEAPCGAIRRLDAIGGSLLVARIDSGAAPRLTRRLSDRDPVTLQPRSAKDEARRPRFNYVEWNDAPQYEAVAGESNVWKITLPEELLKIVREKVAKE